MTCCFAGCRRAGHSVRKSYGWSFPIRTWPCRNTHRSTTQQTYRGVPQPLTHAASLAVENRWLPGYREPVTTTTRKGSGTTAHSSITGPGRKFRDVPDVCAVFISSFYIFKGSLPLYHVDRVVRENGKTVDNGFKEVYVNAKIKDGSEVPELMKYLWKTMRIMTSFRWLPASDEGPGKQRRDRKSCVRL